MRRRSTLSSVNERRVTRAILIVLDSVGCGGAADAKAYGDEGADTLGHIAEACADGRGDRDGLRRGPLKLPRLAALGLGHAMKASTDRAPPGLALAEPRGQWGYGIETSPSMARLTASLALRRGVPADLAEQGVTEAAVSPARLARA